MAQILCPENIELIRIIDTHKPASLTKLAEITGRAKSNLSNTLKKLSERGIVRLERVGNTVKPVAICTDFEIIAGREIEDKVIKAMKKAGLRLPNFLKVAA